MAVNAMPLPFQALSMDWHAICEIHCGIVVVQARHTSILYELAHRNGMVGSCHGHTK